MHVLFIPSSLPSDRHIFEGIYNYHQIVAASLLGHEVGVIYPRKVPMRNWFGPASSGLTLPDSVHFIDYKFLDLGRNRNWAQRFVTRRAALRMFDHYAEQHGRPTILVAQATFYGAYVANMVSKARGIPYAIIAHSSGLIMGSYGPRIAVASTLYREADRVIAVSTYVADAMKGMGVAAEKIAVVPNGVNGVFREGFKKPPAVDDFFILVIGGFNKIKNLGLAIDAMVHLPDHFKMTLVGDGPLRTDVANRVKGNGLTDRIQVLQSMSQKKLKECIDAHHMVLNTSLFETFCIALAEGLARGRPVISTAKGGPVDIIDDSNGIHDCTTDSLELAKNIELLRSRYDQYDFLQIAEKARRKYAYSRISSLLIKQLEFLVRDRETSLNR